MNETTTTVKTTPKDFFLTLGAIITLYVSIVSFLSLVFALINHYLPDIFGYSGNILDTIRWTVSSLIILFPLFLFLSSLVNKDIVAVPEKKNLWIKKWSTYLTLFLTGATVATDLIVLINTFLGGEITLRFVYKVVAVLVVALFVFSFYLYELKRVPVLGDKKVKLYALVASVLVIVSIVAGFLSTGSPVDERLRNLDEERVSHLSVIQDQVVNYWQKKGTLPLTIDELNDPLSSFIVPVDPETKLAYEFNQLSKTTFEICSTFALPSRDAVGGKTPMYYPADPFQSFTHGSGRVCFSRVIDAQLYPVLKK
ncbi:MAG: DUF5671 domain-containing protein [Candidatus Paceibacterota bacterium]|jgi:hypothetical protein